MAIAFRSGTTAHSASTTSLVISKPAGVVDGDLLILLVVTNGAGSFGVPASGFDTSLSDSGPTESISYSTRTANSEPSTYTISAQNGTGGATAVAATLLAYSGGAFIGSYFGVVPFNDTYSGTASVTNDDGGSYIVQSGDIELFVVGSDDSTLGIATSWTPPAGYTNRASITATHVSIEVSEKSYSSTGRTGAHTTTLGASSQGQIKTISILSQPAWFPIINNGAVKGTGVVGTGFAVVGNGGLSFTSPAVSAAGHVGQVGNEVFYARDTGNKAYGWYCPYSGDAPPANNVLVGLNGVSAAGVVGRVSAGADQGGAFQPYAFQANAFQLSLQIVNIAGVSGTGVVGTLGSYKVDYAVTGVVGTLQLGTVVVTMPVTVPVTGVVGTGHVGSLTFTWDMNFTLPRGLYELRAMTGKLGTTGLRVDSSPAPAGVVGTMVLGTVVYESSVSPDGLEASGVLGDISFITDSNPAPAGLQATGGLGLVTFKVDYTIAGVQAAGAVGTLTILVPARVTGLSVQGGGQVGTVGFVIDCNVHPTGVQSAALLNGFDIRVDADVAVAGLASIGQVGSTVEEVAYAAPSVQGSGQVGVVSPTYASAVLGVQGRGQVGTVTIHHDMTVFPAGIFGTGLIGSPEFPHLVVVDRDKMIYTRAPQPGH